MGKIKYAIISLILCLFFAPLFVACGQGVPLKGIAPAKAIYSVLQGEQVQLEINFTPAEATNKGVTYSVLSGEDYVTVDKKGVVTALVVDDKSAHEAQILATSDFYSKYSAIFRIKILANKIVLAQPNNLKYDNAKKAIVWDEVVYKDNPNNQVQIPDYKPYYKLAIANGDVEDITLASEFEVGREDLSYAFGKNAFTESGTYTVWVKSVSDDEETFVDSEYSQRYVFTILDQIENIEVKNYEILTPIADIPGLAVSANNYDLSIYNSDTKSYLTINELNKFVRSSKEIDGKQYVCWSIPHEDIGEDFGTGAFVAYIKMFGDGQRFFDTVQDGAKTFYQLDVPTGVALMENVVIWDEVKYATRYEVVVTTTEEVEGVPTTTTVATIVVEENNCPLTESVLAITEKSITVKAKGNGQERLDGKDVLVDSIKLTKVSGLSASLSGSDTKISWDEDLSAGGYQILLNDVEITTTTSNSFLINDTNTDFVEGTNVLAVVKTPKDLISEDGKHYLSSDKATLTFTKLVNPELSTSGGDIAWNAVNGVFGYELHLIYNVQELNTDTGEMEQKQIHKIINNLGANQTTYSLLNTNSQEFPVGEYKAFVRSLGNDILVRSAKEFTDEEVNAMAPFIKQSAPNGLKISAEGYLSWNEDGDGYMSGECDFIISIHKVVQSGTGRDIEIRLPSNKRGESLTSYLSSEGFGEYSFSVRVVNNKSTLRYLNSEDSESVGFYRLQSPTGLKVQNGGLAWDNYDTGINDLNSLIKNKFRYVLQIRGSGAIVLDQIDLSTGVERYITDYELLQTDCNEGQNSVAIKAEVRGDLTDGNVIEINGSRLFLLSSAFSSNFEFTKLLTPETPEINGDFLRGALVDGAVSYNLTITDSDGSPVSFPIENEQDGYWAAPYRGERGVVNSVEKDGLMLVSVVANGGDSFVNSNECRIPLQLFKMASPTVNIDNTTHKVAWNAVSATINSSTTYATKYLLTYQKNGGAAVAVEISGTTWDTSSFVSSERETYTITIQALSDREDVISSSPSSEETFIKLPAVNYSGISVVNLYPYNTITWHRIHHTEDLIDYWVSVYQRLDSGELKLVKTQLVEDAGLDEHDNDIDPTFVFDNTLKLETYEISIDAVKDGFIRSGVIESNFVVNRLARPTNVTIGIKDNEYNLSWIDLDAVGCYAVRSNNINIYDGITAFNDVNVSERKYSVLIADNLDTGSQKITVQAIKNSGWTTSSNSVTISSAESKEFLAVKLATPVLTVSNGVITWVDTNTTKFGYELSFTHAQASSNITYVNLKGDESTFDMDDENLYAGTQYKVRIKAKGDGKVYISSNEYRGLDEKIIEKLVAPNPYVEQGLIKWEGVTNAAAYDAVVYETLRANDKYSQRGITGYKDVGGVKIYQMPQAPLQNKSGEISYTLQSVGTTVSDLVNVYITSAPTAVKTVNKWAVPTGVRIQEGEINWNRISASEERTGSGLIALSCYKITFGEESTTVLRSEKFFLSTYVKEDTTMDIKVCCVGTPTKTFGDGAWINSDYTSNFSVTIANKPSLYVENGVLKWADVDEQYYDDYELSINIGGTIYNILVNSTETLLTENTLSVADDNSLQYLNEIVNATNISSVKVRHKGVAYSEISQYGNYVNSDYSSEVSNIHKLPKAINMQINDDGLLQWNQESNECDVVVMLNDSNYTTYDFVGHDANGNICTMDVQGKYFDVDGADYSVRISFHTQKDSNGSDYYLKSEDDYIYAYRFSAVNNIDLSDDKLFLEWQYINQSASASNDKFIVSYNFVRAGDPVNFTIPAVSYAFEKEFTENDLEISDNNNGTKTARVPLWGIGTYQISIRVASTSLNVIPSDSRDINQLKYDAFYGGSGTMDYPFIIKTTTQDSFYSRKITATEQFYNIKKLPQLYFSLDEDVELYGSDRLDIENGLWTNFLFTEEEQAETIFTGGIFGNGHKVSNYQIYQQSLSSSLFYNILGCEVEDASTANNFFGRRGVINGLELEISRFDYADYYKEIGFFATHAYGAWFVNCKVGLSETAFPDGLEILAQSASSNILYGGIVAKLFAEIPASEQFLSYNDGEVMDRKAKIIGCISDIDITIRFTRYEDLQNSNSQMGGIVGAIYGASIIDCVNEGKLGGSQVGGIVYLTADVNVESEVNWVNVISGCLNKGKITSYTTKVDGSPTGTQSLSGGIVSYCDGRTTYITNCLQTGELAVVNGNYVANSNNSSKVVAIIGGIVGDKRGNIIMINTLNIASKVSFDSNTVLFINPADQQSQQPVGSVFYGLSATTLNAVYGSYYLVDEQSNYYRGVASSLENWGVSEVNMKQGTNMTFASFGTVDNINKTVTNIPNNINYSSGSVSSSLLYEALMENINLLYFNGIDNPALRAYEIE